MWAFGVSVAQAIGETTTAGMLWWSRPFNALHSTGNEVEMKSVRFTRMMGIDVRLHPSFFLLAGLGAIYALQGGLGAALDGVTFLVLLSGCVLLHELGHAWAAERYGAKTKDIILLPTGGVARPEKMPTEPKQELVVALAGPAVNVVIAALVAAALLGANLGAGLDLAALAGAGGLTGLAVQLLTVNVLLVLFNLLPAFPMGGGRVLRALLATRLPYARATSVAARTGQGLAVLMAVYGLFYNPFLVLVAVFVFVSAGRENTYARTKVGSSRLPVSAVMLTGVVSLSPHDSLLNAADTLARTAQPAFPVLTPSGVAGVLTKEALLLGLKTRGATTAVRDAMHTSLPTVRLETPFDEAFERMQEHGLTALPVTDGLDRLMGMVTLEKVRERLRVQGALERGRRGPRAARPRVGRSPRSPGTA